MSYIDRAAFVPAQSASSEGPEAPDELDGLDRQVVRLSLCDGANSLSECNGRRSRLSSMLGGHQSKALASPRLEALRRYAVRYRLGGGVLDAAETSRLQNAGYSEGQVRAAEQLLDGLRPDLVAQRPRSGRIALIVVSIMLSIGGCLWLSVTVEDPLIAVVIFGALVASVLSVFSNRTQ